MPPTRAQTIKIHIAIKELGIDDDTYRDMLAMNFEVLSSTKLNPEQAGVLLALLRAKGWQPKSKQGGKSWGGKSQYIKTSDPQQRKVLALWNSLGYDMAKLHARVKKQFGADRFEWLRDHDALHTLITDLEQRLKNKTAGSAKNGQHHTHTRRVPAQGR